MMPHIVKSNIKSVSRSISVSRSRSISHYSEYKNKAGCPFGQPAWLKSVFIVSKL